jgi:hypothetical protein
MDEKNLRVVEDLRNGVARRIDNGCHELTAVLGWVSHPLQPTSAGFSETVDTIPACLTSSEKRGKNIAARLVTEPSSTHCLPLAGWLLVWLTL